MLMKLMTNF